MTEEPSGVPIQIDPAPGVVAWMPSPALPVTLPEPRMVVVPARALSVVFRPMVAPLTSSPSVTLIAEKKAPEPVAASMPIAPSEVTVPPVSVVIEIEPVVSTAWMPSPPVVLCDSIGALTPVGAKPLIVALPMTMLPPAAEAKTASAAVVSPASS